MALLRNSSGRRSLNSRFGPVVRAKEDFVMCGKILVAVCVCMALLLTGMLVADDWVIANPAADWALGTKVKVNAKRGWHRGQDCPLHHSQERRHNRAILEE